MRNELLIRDVKELFTLTAKDIDLAFAVTEGICVNVSPMAQVFWTTMFYNALDAYLETAPDA